MRQSAENLLPVNFPLSLLKTDPESAAAKPLWANLKHPHYLGDQPGLTQTLRWIDAWSTRGKKPCGHEFLDTEVARTASSMRCYRSPIRKKRSRDSGFVRAAPASIGQWGDRCAKWQGASGPLSPEIEQVELLGPWAVARGGISSTLAWTPAPMTIRPPRRKPDLCLPPRLLRQAPSGPSAPCDRISRCFAGWHGGN